MDGALEAIGALRGQLLAAGQDGAILAWVDGAHWRGFIPTAARAGGANGSAWLTDVALVAAGDGPVEATVTFRSGDGVRWQKLRTNPILELGAAGAFDENGLGEPAVWLSPGRYWMLYTGRDRRENRRIGFAWSTDGVRWKRLAADSVFAGGEAWNSKVVCDPSVLAEGDAVRVWFGGGDVASPDQNLHGRIGLATLEPVGANLSE